MTENDWFFEELGEESMDRETKTWLVLAIIFMACGLVAGMYMMILLGSL